jgi:transposase
MIEYREEPYPSKRIHYTYRGIMDLSIGIDVSKMSLDVAFYDGAGWTSFICSNDHHGIALLKDKLKGYEKDQVIITMEATGNYHLFVANTLYADGYTVSVINPLVIKRFGDMKMIRAKTDAVDARVIAQYGLEQRPAFYIPKEENCQKIIYYLKAIEDLLLMKSQIGQRIEALSVCPDAPEDLIISFQKIKKTLLLEIKGIEDLIKTLIQDTYKSQYNRLASIPGIGKRTAVAFIGYFNEFERFETAKQVASFIGVNPSARESGTSIRGRGVISRKGNAYLRKLIYMAALSASKHNDSCRDLYERLQLKGKDKKLALIAVANKLIRQIFAIVKYEREYISLYHMQNMY